MLYHGVRHTPAGCLYRTGLALLDPKDPTRCVRRSDQWSLGPETEYERNSDVGSVGFPCGYTIADDRDTIRVYYGAADSSICLATASLQELVDGLLACPEIRATPLTSLRRPDSDAGSEMYY